jgi:LacI family transcriptional regulator
MKAAIELCLQLIESKRPIKEFEKRILTPELQIRESSIKKTAKVTEDLTHRAKPIHLQE